MPFLIAGYLLYSPPILERKGYNLPGRVYDSLAYIYHITAATWRESSADPAIALRSAARAAWHRPSRTRELLGVPTDDLPVLARVYDSLGLEREAVLLLRKALTPPSGEEDRDLELLSYLAAMGDWEGTKAAGEKLLAANPDCPETSYWLGRGLLETGFPARAAEHFRRALHLRPDLADALFWLGSIEEAAANGESAKIFYERAAAAAPGHRRAREGLARLYRDRGEVEKAREVEAVLRDLVPPVRAEKRLRNYAILRGLRPSAPALGSGEEVELEIFLEGLNPREVAFDIDLKLVSINSPEEWIRPAGTAVLKGPGQVSRFKIVQVLPPTLYPGEISLGVIFRGGEDAVADFDRFRLFPAWTASVDREPLIGERFGFGARSLGRQAFLGPGDELELRLDPPLPAAGLGIVSYLHRGIKNPQGAEIGLVVVATVESDELVCPQRAGLETAEVWWGFTPPWRRSHQPAEIFRSWPVEAGDRRFRGAEYYSVCSFPGLRTVAGLMLKNTTGEGGWAIRDLVLIPPTDPRSFPARLRPDPVLKLPD